MISEAEDPRDGPLLEAGAIPVINFCDFANVYVLEGTAHFWLVRRRLIVGERVREPVAELIAPASDVAEMAQRMLREIERLTAGAVRLVQ